MKAFRLITAGAMLAGSIAVAAPAQAAPYGSISGHVTDDTGAPLADVCVTAEGYDYSSTVTDADGAYFLEGLSAGGYRVHFEDCSRAPTRMQEWYNDKPTYDQADPVLVKGAEVAGIDASLALGGKISGHLTDTSGAPAPDVCIAVLDDDWNFLAASASNEDGSYTVGALPTGAVRIEFGECYLRAIPVGGGPKPMPTAMSATPVPPRSAYGYVPEWYNDKPDFDSADPVAVTAPNTTSGIDAALVPAGQISGTVTGPDGDPASWVCVDAHDSTWEHGGWAQTDGDGTYRMDGLVPGTYKVHFFDCSDDHEYKDEWYDNRTQERDANPVVVTSGADTSGIDAELARLPRPDVGIDSLSVEPVPLQTDVATLPSTGWNRRVNVAVGNHGDGDADYARLTLWATTPSDQVTREIASMNVDVTAGGTVKRAVDWNGFGTAGDVTITAQVCAWRDRNASNDAASVRSYVLVGGSGFGMQPGARSYPDYIPPCNEDWGYPPPVPYE